MNMRDVGCGQQEKYLISFHFWVAQKMDNRNGRDFVHIRVNFTLSGYLTK